jgi:hypothetical protein
MIATAKGHQKFGKTDALMSFLRVFITMIFFVKFLCQKENRGFASNKYLNNILNISRNNFEAAGRNENEAGGESVNVQNS